MSDNDNSASESDANNFPVIRKIKASAIIGWLKAGIKDTRHGGLASLFYGVFFAGAGLLMHTVIIKAYWLLAGLTTGISPARSIPRDGTLRFEPAYGTRRTT